MRYLVVTRAETNGGDHLIAHKLTELFKREKSSAEVVYRGGTENFDLNYIRSFDRLILGGGPLYENRLLNSEAFPLLSLIIENNIPTTIFGAGWYGSNGDADTIYSYEFSDFALKLFDTIIRTGGYLGCRDHITARVLKNNKQNNVIMTGCPVWYDFSDFDKLQIKKTYEENISKIAISDPGITKRVEEQEFKADQAINLIQLLMDKFPKTKLFFTFNNGIETKYSYKCNLRIKTFLEQNNIEYYSFKNSHDSFVLYNDVDLHVGYRLHSHLYTLSKRIPSLLIEEDARAYGTNHTLGLAENLTSYDIKANLNNQIKPNDKFLLSVNDAIDEMIVSNFMKVQNAVKIMKETYYETVKYHISYI